jgi:hypothetical protein
VLCIAIPNAREDESFADGQLYLLSWKVFPYSLLRKLHTGMKCLTMKKKMKREKSAQMPLI